MPDPKIVERRPAKVECEPGKYAWCACGESANQPFCDGSHKGTGFRPAVIEVAEREDVFFCNCKHTQNPPYCDGTHKSL